jgi:hypothetical protein
MTAASNLDGWLADQRNSLLLEGMFIHTRRVENDFCDMSCILTNFLSAK